MISRLHLVVLVALATLGCASANAVAPLTVSGVVRDSAGVPQIGVVVQLLRADLSVITSVYTNEKGQYNLPATYPGRYSVKAIAASFLPSMREGVRVHSATVVNLTLNTLYEVMQWLPTEPRGNDAQQDDWKWTLRSAANRPLLRWLEDGPLVVVSDSKGSAPKLKARLMATGQEGSFGEEGERFSATVEDTPSSSRELLARVDFDPRSEAGVEAMLGFRQDLGYAGSVQSLAAVTIQPEVGVDGEDGSSARPASGLEEAGIRSEETMNLGDEFVVEAGSEQVLAAAIDHSLGTQVAVLPFASLVWRKGYSELHYGMTSIVPSLRDEDDTDTQASLPRISTRNGNLQIERGLHQEIGWERHTDRSSTAVLLYADQLDNPVLEAMGHFAVAGDRSRLDPEQMALVDRASGMLRAAANDFSATGVLASYGRSLPGQNQLHFSYANGNALVLAAQQTSSSAPRTLAQAFAAAHPRRAQMYSISLSGTLEGSGTRWRASYRWQPSETVSPVAAFAGDAGEPYLNLHVRQPLHLRVSDSGHVDALLDVRNLLSEGYRPFLLSDGSVLVVAQDGRSIRAGLVFTF